MSRRTAFLAPAALALALVAGHSHAATLNGNLALTSDYVWRGISQSNDAPAVQAGLKWTGETGFYASAWASNVEFAPALEASSEFDFALGWSGALGEQATLDVSAIHYLYPSTTADLDWTEANATLTVASNYWLSAGWSNDALALDVDGVYLQAGARLQVGERLRFEAIAGHYDVDSASGPDTYAHVQVNAVWALRAPLEARLSLHDTNANAETLYGAAIAGRRVEVALQYAF